MEDAEHPARSVGAVQRQSLCREGAEVDEWRARVRCRPPVYFTHMKAILLIDHGSLRSEANEMLGSVQAMVQEMAGPHVLVEYAHMELAEPTIEQGFAA